MPHAYSVKPSEEICKALNVLQIRKILSDVYVEHVEAIVHSVFMLGYKGKVVNTELFSEKHRTTVSHFLNNGKAKSTTRQMSILLHQVFDMAVEDGYTRTNPTESKRLPLSGVKKKREVQDILQSLDRLRNENSRGAPS